MFPILTGIVGSTAYGLDGPGSDIDTLGVFAHPTEAFFGLDKLDETVKKHKDDTSHEAAKYCRLALGGNPTVMELMWLPRELYTFESRLGLALIGIRDAFLSAPRVRDAYLGYATQQFKELKKRGGTFSSDTQHRTAKHARHLARLLVQGKMLHLTGYLQIKLDYPEKIISFGEDVASGNIDLAERAIAEAENTFNSRVCALPERPDKEQAELWLEDVRRSYLDRPKRTE